MDNIINASSLEDIITQLKGTPYAAPLIATKEKILKQHSVFSFEVALDQMYYEMMLHDSEKFDGRDRDIIRRLVGIEIDLQNINFLIRLHAFYKMPVNDALNFIIPRGYNFNSKMLAEAVREDSVTDVVGKLVRKKYSGLSTLLSAQTVDSTSRLILIERILDQILLYEVRRALSGYPFTIGVVLAYFVLKHNEHKKLISVLNAKQYGMSESRIEEMI